MFWDKLSNKEKLGLSLALAVMAIALLDRLVFSPIRSRFQRINKAIKINEKQLAHDLRNVRQEGQITRQFEKYVEYVQRSGSDEEEVAKILGEIESLARQSAIYLANMKPQTPKEIDFYKEYAVEIDAEGEIGSLISFLHHLNMSTQLLRVEKLRLSSNKKGDKVLKASLLVTRVLVM
ncbi:MAG: type 4a pilus biogenesis protein PilO [Candidatus Omnitrophica bacterium]|nr:type 4a pilus biogenesis protein PilO [Candidatus Omnitrophota bacterium]